VYFYAYGRCMETFVVLSQCALALAMTTLALGRGRFQRPALLAWTLIAAGGALANAVTGHWLVLLLWLANVAIYLPRLRVPSFSVQ
jgi:hypothetical protein